MKLRGLILSDITYTKAQCLLGVSIVETTMVRSQVQDVTKHGFQRILPTIALLKGSSVSAEVD